LTSDLENLPATLIFKQHQIGIGLFKLRPRNSRYKTASVPQGPVQ
jgi:hypothetical protein